MRISPIRRALYWLGLVGLAVLFTVGGLVCLNVAARALKPQPRIESYQPLYVSDEWLPFVLKPGAVIQAPYGVYGEYAELFAKADERYEIAINSRGCRGPEFVVPKPAGALRIVVLGDSSSFGWDTPLEKTFFRRLERGLRDAPGNENVEVISASVPNYSSWYGLVYLERRVLQFEPDLLIVSFGRNDELDSAFSPQSFGRNLSDREFVPRAGGFVQNLGRLERRNSKRTQQTARSRLRSTELYQSLTQLIQGEPKYQDHGIELSADAVYRVSLSEYSDNLREIARLAEAAGADVLFLEIGVLHPQYREAMGCVADELGAPFLSMFDWQMLSCDWVKQQPDLAEDRALFIRMLGRETLDQSPGGWLWYTTDFCHPNAMGHAVIERELRPLVMQWLAARRGQGD